MSGLLSELALLVAVVGIALAVTTLLATRSVGIALPTLLDFLLAAGLLRLSATSAWTAIASAALIVAIRKIASLGIAASAPTRAADSS